MSPEDNLAGGLLLLRTLRMGGGEEPSALTEAWRRAPLAGMPALVRLERSAIWLLRRLREIGAEASVDSRFLKWLSMEVRAETARNMLIESRALELARWLDVRGIPFVFTKGTARGLLGDRYAGIDARVTTDVDVLLRDVDAEPAWQALQEEGYRYAASPELLPAGHYHLIPLTSSDGVSIELHTSTSLGVPPAEAWHRSTDRATLVEREGLRLTVPSATEMLWLAVTHAEIDGSAAYDLRHFQDAATLIGVPDVNWSLIEARFDTPEIREPARMRAWSTAAAWLAGGSLPSAVTSGIRGFDLERALIWRHVVCERAAGYPRVILRLVDEATRVEAGLGMARCLEGTPLRGIARRRLATSLARGGYLLWRSTTR